MAWACMAATGTGSFVFIDTAGDSMNTEVYRNILLAQMHQMYWTMLHLAARQLSKTYKLKQPLTFFRPKSGMDLTDQVKITSIQLSMHFTCRRLKANRP